MARLIHILLLFVAFASCKTLAADLYADSKLPDCEFDTEVQFYTSEIDVSGLPEACYNDVHLTTIGFLIQVCVFSYVCFHSIMFSLKFDSSCTII
jgi:hypothetical protein